MDDLARWLTAQFDEDERIARAATPGPWRNAPTARCHATVSGRSEEAVFASPPDTGATVVAITGEAVERRHLVDAEHIARWDPARVLRETTAKREIVEQHRPVGYGDVCLSYCHTRTPSQPQTWPCLTLRLLALPFADRPGFREEWRP